MFQLRLEDKLTRAADDSRTLPNVMSCQMSSQTRNDRTSTNFLSEALFFLVGFTS